MKNRSLIALLLLFAMLLTGCAGGSPAETESPSAPPEQTETQEPTQVPEPTGTPEPTEELPATPSDLFTPPVRHTEIPEPTPTPEELGPGIKTYTGYNTGSRFTEGDLVVATATGYIFPYVLFEWGNVGNNGVFRVDTVFRFTLTDGTEENWLLLSTVDGSDIGEYTLYTKLHQIWLREADAVAYTEDSKRLVRWPVWVEEGARDVNGVVIDWSNHFVIRDEYEDPNLGELVKICTNGGVGYWVSRKVLVYYDIEG